MVEDWVDMGQISFHGCIKNTSTDAAVLIKHQLIPAEAPDNWKEICGSTHNSVEWRKEGRRRESRTNCSWGLGSWSRGDIPASGAIGWDGGETSETIRVKQLICDNLNGVRTTQTIRAVVLLTSRQGCKSTSAHSGWELEAGMGEQSQGEPGLFLTMGRRPEEMGGWKSIVGKAFGGKWVWKQGTTTESWAEAGAIPVNLSPQTCWHQQMSKKERPQWEWPFECLMHWAIQKDQPGKPFECKLPEARKES